MIIAFSWTTSSLLAREKTATWRDWSTSHALHFHSAGLIVEAWDKNPRVHGQCVGLIRLTAPAELTRSSKMPDEFYVEEGLAWYHAHPEFLPKRIFGRKATPEMMSREQFDRGFRAADLEGYVVRFELVSLTDYGRELQAKLTGVAVAA